MRILIEGGGFQNKGAEAMLRTVQNELGKRISGLTFAGTVVLGDMHRAERAGVTPICGARTGKLQKLARLLRTVLLDPCLIGRAFSNPRAFLLLKAACDPIACIDVKGFTFSDTWGRDDLAESTLGLVQYCAKVDIPYVFMPQAWGPFSLRKLASDTRAMCLLATTIYARDKESKSHLNELLVGSAVKVNLAPDIAFRFQADPPELGEQILSSSGLKMGEKPIVGIVPNCRIYDRMLGENAENEYVKILGEIVKFYLGIGANVVLIPHEIIAHGRHQDDRHLCSLVRSVYGSDSVGAMVGEYSAGAIKSVIGHLDFMVGSRFHSLVAALSCRVPAVAISWSHKYVELMSLVGCEKYVVDFTKLELPAFLKLLEDAWNQRVSVRHHLEDKLPQIEREVDLLFDSVAQLIRSRLQKEL